LIDEMTEIGTGGGCSNLVGLIPVRNLWLLMLYASELLRYQEFGRYGRSTSRTTRTTFRIL